MGHPSLSHVIEYEIGAPYEYQCIVKAEARTIKVTYTDLYTGETKVCSIQLQDWQITNINQLCEVAMSFKGEYMVDSPINDCEYSKLSIDKATRIILVDRFAPAPTALKQLCDYMNLYSINNEYDK